MNISYAYQLLGDAVWFYMLGNYEDSIWIIDGDGEVMFFEYAQDVLL